MSTPASAERGFPDAEYHARVTRAQAGLTRIGAAGLLLTTDADIRYFTGFLTRFWESPTRPWFLIVPAQGAPVAVIPAIGAALMAQSWISDIRTWRAPDYSDDGVSLLRDALLEMGGPVAVPSGLETHLRMPLDSWNTLTRDVPFVSDQDLMFRLRNIKSEAEIAKIAQTCAVADRAFARVPEIARAGVGLDAVFRKFQMLLLEEGADWVPYLAGASDAGGYSDVISPATPDPLAVGDVLMLDTGAILDGYFCDFDRNFSIGAPEPEVEHAHDRLIEAVDVGADAARPGARVSDLFHAMDRILTGGAGGADAGRLGHGLGLQLTEGVSIIAQDHTPLEVGMVLTLEPGIETGAGKMLVHEENIAITAEGPVFLSTRRRDLVVL